MTVRPWSGAIRQAWPYALISGGTALVAFFRLPPQSLPGKYLQGDEYWGLAYAICGALAASLAILTLLIVRGRRGGERPLRHLAVPPVLALLIPLVLILSGAARSRLWTGALCAAVAVVTHVAMALPRRRIRVTVWAAVAAAAVLTTTSCQTAWRAEDFEATGLPYYVADVPGYHLSSTYADVHVIVLTYHADDVETVWLDAIISRYCSTVLGTSSCIDLPDNASLGYGRPERGGSGIRDPLPTGVTVRPVSATHLASFRTGISPLPD
jgi:hypothetical protein